MRPVRPFGVAQGPFDFAQGLGPFDGLRDFVWVRLTAPSHVEGLRPEA